MAQTLLKVKKYRMSRKILFDIGANIGHYTSANYEKYDSIVCVDAQKDVCDILNQRFQGDKCIVVNALVTNDEKAVFYKNTEWSFGVLSTSSEFWRTQSRFGTMPSTSWIPVDDIATITIESLISTYGKPSFIKIDVEGSELSVLQTMKEYTCPLAFEFAEELVDELIKSIEYLYILGYSYFHIQEGDEYTYEPKEWVTYWEVVKTIQQTFIPTRKSYWGMVWAKKDCMRIPLFYDKLFDKSLEEKMFHNAALKGLDTVALLEEPSKSPIRLIAHLSMCLPKNSKVINLVDDMVQCALLCNPDIQVTNSLENDALVLITEKMQDFRELYFRYEFKGIVFCINQTDFSEYEEIPMKKIKIAHYAKNTGLLICDDNIVDVEFPCYRLGNLLVMWFMRAFLPIDKYTENERKQLIYFHHCNKDTFGYFLNSHFPIFKMPELPFERTDWWWSDYQKIVDIHPYFTFSLRHAILEYQKDKVCLPTTHNTLVIHCRIGDGYHSSVFPKSRDSLQMVLDKLPRTPDTIELLSGGMHHYTPIYIQDMSKSFLQHIANDLQVMYPDASVVLCSEDRSADADFMKMVHAPMLLTGNSSFAIMAAIANTNFRLSPNRLEFNSDPFGEHVFENWHTYEAG